MSSHKVAGRARRRSKDERSALEQQAVMATLALFADGGFEAVSMRRLAAEVGVAPMTLYRYFPSKSHLLRHIWHDVLGRACAQASSSALRGRTARSRLSAFVGGYVLYWLEAREHYHAVFGNHAPQYDGEGDGPRPDLEPVRSALTGLVTACADGSKTPLQVRWLAEEAHWLILGFLASMIAIEPVAADEALQAKARLIDTIVSRAAGAHAGAAATVVRARARRTAG